MPTSGIPIPEVPLDLSDELAVIHFLQSVRNILVRMQPSYAPPSPVTNLRATAMAGANLVEFTRSDGERYMLYWGTTPDQSNLSVVDLGISARYIDQVGASGVKRYYWVGAWRGNVESDLAGPVSATTLALNQEIVPPDPPPASSFVARSHETGRVVFTDGIRYLRT